MLIAESLDALSLPAPSLVTIGTFDGVHRGHLFLLEQARQRAVEQGYHLVIVTFDPCPAVVLRPAIGRYQLTSARQKLGLLAPLEPALVGMIPFTRDIARLTADEFMDRLERALDLREMWLGEDFHFGRDRAGGIAMLLRRSQSDGFAVHVVERRMEERTSISSTRIREALSRGAVDEAIPLLGRPFELDLRELEPAVAAPGAFNVPAHLELPASGRYAAQLRDEGARSGTVAVRVARDAASGQLQLAPSAEAGSADALAFIAQLGASGVGDERLETLQSRAEELLRDWRPARFQPSGDY